MKFPLEYERAFAFTVGVEGGYCNDPVDPGGETKYGVSKRAYPTLDIKSLTLEQAKIIYYKDYWLKAGCEQKEWPLNLVVFDTAVNRGLAAALKDLKEWGKTGKPVALIVLDLLFERLEDYCDIVATRPASLKYLQGWVRRVIHLYRKGVR